MARAYVSKLRAEQTAATRLRVINAVGAILSQDVSEFTIPRVAAEAGVSAATVQRLFPTKRDLVEGLAQHYAATTGSLASLEQLPPDLEDQLATITEIFKKTADLEPAMRAAVTSEAFRRYRRDTRAKRLRAVEGALKRFRSDFSATDFRHARNLFAVLASSYGLQAFTELTGSTPEEAAATVTWTMRRLLGPKHKPRR